MQRNQMTVPAKPMDTANKIPWHSKSLICWFYKVWPWWPLGHFQRSQLFHLNTEMVIKRGFSVLWRWL